MAAVGGVISTCVELFAFLAVAGPQSLFTVSGEDTTSPATPRNQHKEPPTTHADDSCMGR